jgi:hypothetical protein
METKLKFILPFLLVVFFSGCQIFDKPELVPSYLEIDNFDLTTVSGEGSNSSKIKDCWVYANSNLVGVFELPARVPIFLNGEVDIQVYPGIYKNGIKDERTIYPFYTHYSNRLNLQPDSTIKITPQITYEENLNIWIEDFEDPGFKLNVFVNNSDTAMFIAKANQYNDLFEGDAGLIKMSSNNILCEMRTDEPLFYSLPRDLGIPAYFELDYKCNHSFLLGLLDNNTGLSAYNQTTLITFNPTTDDNGEPQWNKTYLYIPDVTNFYQNATKFDFFISVFNNDGTDNIEVFVDNLKVVFEK